MFWCAWVPCLAWALAIDPESARFRRLDQDHGLTQSSVLAIAQDSQGYVWLGTQDGLNRFDGFDIRPFRPDRLRADSLSNNWVGALRTDAAGKLWVGTQAGLNRFEPDSEAFTIFRHQAEVPGSLAGDSVHAVHVDAEGRVWVGSNGGLSRWRPATDDFETFSLPPATANGVNAADDQRVRALASDPDGTLWVGTVRGLWRFDPARAGFAPAPGGSPTALAPIHALAMDTRRRLWVGSNGEGLAMLDVESGRWQTWRHDPDDPASLGHDQVHSLLARANGEVWAGTEVGVDRLRETSSGFHLAGYRHHRHNANSLGRGRVTAMMEDQAGTLWIGSWEGGVSRLNQSNNRFLSYSPDVPTTHAMRSPGVAALAAAGTDLWLGGAEGLYRFDTRDNSLHPQPEPRDLFIYGIVPRGDALWLGTRQGLRVVGADGIVRPGPVPDELVNQRTRRFLLEPARIWLAADTLGLYVVDARDQSIKAFHPIASVVTFVEVLDNDTVLVGAHDGLYWFSRDGGALRHHHTVQTTGDETRLIAGPSALHRGRDGQLWMATYGGGLLRLDLSADGDPAAARFVRFGREQGLAEESINALLEDPQGHLWMSINGYISRFDPVAGRFRNFDRADGVLPRYWIGAMAQLDSGLMAFAGPDGFSLFDPAAMTASSPPPGALLTMLELDNRPTALRAVDPQSPLVRPLHRLDRLDLPPARARTLSLRFSAPDYVAPEQLRFAYRLDGFDRDWIEVDSARRFATYTNLAHGEYRFRVKVRNGDGAWSEQETHLDIRIAPFWWQTWWAAALLVLLAALLLAAGFLLRIRQLGRQRQQLQEQVDLRTGELRRALQKLTVSERLAAAGQLTAGLAHELNNPANYVQVASQNLAHALGDFQRFLIELGGEDLEPEVAGAITGRVDAMQDQIGTILEGNRRISRIVQDLRVFSRLDEAERKSVALDEPLRAALHLLRSRFGPDLELIEAIDELPAIECQPAQLSQAFMSLIQNACQAIEGRRGVLGTAYRGRLEVACQATEGTARIEIRDNGGGIDPAARTRLFEPFFTTREVGDGSGLGLSVAWGIVAEHGGRIEVESAPGEGSLFRVVLPT